MDFKKLYDLTPTEKEALDWRQARREKLRQEYLHSQHNPLNKKPFIDEGLQRYIAQVMCKDQYFNGNVWSAAIPFTILVGAIGLTCYCLAKTRGKKENRIRSGQIAYIDRLEKFK